MVGAIVVIAFLVFLAFSLNLIVGLVKFNKEHKAQKETQNEHQHEKSESL